METNLPLPNLSKATNIASFIGSGINGNALLSLDSETN